MTAPFNVKEVADALRGTRFHSPLVHLRVTGSTNQLALEAASAGASGGVWIADEQTAGRGRGGHTWHSAPGEGLYVSALVVPDLPLASAALLPIATGLAVRAGVLEVTGLTLDIRWPNDLMFADAKCGGILVESASEPTRKGSGPSLRYAVIGIGLNVRHRSFPPELSRLATSLYAESGRLFDREPILVAILKQLDRELELLRVSARQGDPLRPDGGSALQARLAQASTWVSGKRVRVGADEHGSGGYTGWTRGLDPSGFLLVEADDGVLHTVLSGGVRSAKD